MIVYITRTIDCPVCGKEVYRINGRMMDIRSIKDINCGTYRQAHNTPCCGGTEADFTIAAYEVEDGVLFVDKEEKL